MFAEERPALRPLPVEPFRYYQSGTRTVHLDNCIEVDYAYYSAPPGWLGHDVAVQWNASHVRLLDPSTGQLLREHRRHAARGRHAIHPDDRPPRTPPTTVTLLAQAARAGTHIGPPSASSSAPAWPPAWSRDCSRRRPSSWPQSTSCPRSSATSCFGVRTGFSTAASSRPASGTWARRSTPSTSSSTRR